MAFAVLALLRDIWVRTCITSTLLGCLCIARTCTGGRGRLAAKHPLLLPGSPLSSCSSEGFRLNVLFSGFEALNPVCFQLCRWTGRWSGGCGNHLLWVEEQHQSGSAKAVAAASPIARSGPDWWGHPFPRKSGPALGSPPRSLLWSPSPRLPLCAQILEGLKP